MLSLEKFREIDEFGIADLALLIQESMTIFILKLDFFSGRYYNACSSHTV